VPYERELAVAEVAARAAGKLVLEHLARGITVDRKAGDEPVTEADRAASALILRELTAAFPDDVLVSEEAAPPAERLERPRVWYIDPIDGTRDFIAGRPGFAVMIGLVESGVPTVGVVFQPIGSRLFRAAPGRPCELVDEAGVARTLTTSATADPAALRLVASRSHRTPVIDQVKNVLGIEDEMNIGSVGLKLGLIAAGDRDLYVNPGSHCKAWDTAAPEALLLAAGGRLTDIHGRKLRYDQERMAHGNGLLATNGAAHDAVLAKLAPLFPVPTS
jgi:3'(2'), 5'-bisphosphate nucleotidase